MSANTINVSASGSIGHLQKGESLRDTALTLRRPGRSAGSPVTGLRIGPALAPVDRRTVSTASLGAGGASSGEGRGDQCRRRRQSAPHPGAARRADHPAADGRLSKASGWRHRRRRAAQPGGPFQRAVAVDPGRGGGAGRTAHAAAGRCRRLAGHGVQRPRRRTPAGRRGADAARAGRTDERRVLPVLAGVLGDATGCPRSARRSWPTTRSCCTPVRCCAAWRSRTRWPTRRNQQCCNRFPTVCISGWRCCSTYSSDPKRGNERMTATIPGSRRSCPPAVVLRGYAPTARVTRSTCWSTTVRSQDRPRPGGRSGPRRRHRRAPARCCCPASSTCTPICVSRAASTPRHIESGSAAAALGGFTAVFAMANTEPVADSPVVTDHVWNRGRQVGLVDVHPVGRGHRRSGGQAAHRDGHDGQRRRPGRMFSDDGKCVDDPLVMRRALEYATGLGVLIAQHAEEPRLTVGAVAHEGPNAARLGLAGWPRSAEESIVARDAILARDAGRPRAHLPRLDRGHRRDPQMGQGSRHFDHRRGDPAPPAAGRQPAGDLRRRQPGQPAAA